MKKRSSSIFLAGILVLAFGFILYDFSYEGNIEKKYVGMLYMLEEDNLVELEDAALSLSGTQIKSLQSGINLNGQLAITTETQNETCFFLTLTSDMVHEVGWCRALLSSGPPVGGPLKIGVYTCNEMYFEKHLHAVAMPMEDETNTVLFVAVEEKGDLEHAKFIAFSFFQGND